MLRLAFASIALAVLLLVQPAQAQTKAKPKRCLSEAEMLVEQLVRHGIFLREAGWRCDEFVPGTLKLWQEFDTANAERLKQQTEKRKRTFQRAFKDDWIKVMTYFDGRLVTYHRHFPLTQPYCTNVDELLKAVAKKGWGTFRKQAETVQNEVYLDYKICQ